MNNLDGFLKKFKLILGARGEEIELAAKELSLCIGVEIPKETVSVKNNVVAVEARPGLKSQIFLKKKQILESFKKHPALQKIADVR